MHLKSKTIYYLSGIIICLLLISSLIYILTAEESNAPKERIGKNEADEEQPLPMNTDKIRVLIKTDGFEHIVHPEIQLQAAGGLVAEFGEQSVEYTGEEVLTVTPDDPMFDEGNVVVRPKIGGEKITVLHLNRGYGTPAYRGIMELTTTAEGIALVNELRLEEYLYGVVPSEMPSSYEGEALKVQAVCARSYAYCHMASMAYPEYHANVDDSVSYQVYGNSAESDSAILAVSETNGEKLLYNGNVVKAYYFSTSSGNTTSVEAWGTTLDESNSYLQSAEVSCDEGYYEKDLAWFSWQAIIPEEVLSNLIGLNTATDIGTLQNVEVTVRGSGDIAQQIVATGSSGSVTVDTENKIRSALGGGGYQITRQDGSVVDCGTLLPSAFFTIRKEEGNYVIDGGGYGHGIGMSQNGANEMAKQGKSYKEILQLFYKGVEVTAD